MVLPAYAGMILTRRRLSWPRIGAPRVCGDDPGVAWVDDAQVECSPRMRG